MALVSRSIAWGNRMSLLGLSNGRSMNMSAKAYFSTDPRSPDIGDCNRDHYNNPCYDASNPILNTYENNFSRIDARNTYPRVQDWKEKNIVKTYESYSVGKPHNSEGNEKQNVYGGDYEGYVQINTYETNYYGSNVLNKPRYTYYSKVRMSKARSNDGNERSTFESTDKFTDSCAVISTFGGDYDGDKQRDTCKGDVKDKASECLCSFAPICLACAGGPCPSRPTKYDSRKYKPNLPKDDVDLNFEKIPNVPSGVFRPTEGECLGHNNAAKCSCYQNPEYFSFHNMTFYDMHLVLRPVRRPCPKTGRKP